MKDLIGCAVVFLTLLCLVGLWRDWKRQQKEKEELRRRHWRYLDQLTDREKMQ